MAQSLESFELKDLNDYKYLACVIGEKLRNPNFQSSNREAFLRTVL